MYSILGRIAKGTRENFTSLLSIENEKKFRNLNYIDLNSKSACLATSGEGTKFIGTASKDGITLVYLGAIHHPFPCWLGSDNPLHDTLKTARILLDRYLSDNDTCICPGFSGCKVF